jgi:mannose-6-phosphate isomerase-like protein (cupin superfamily)
VSGGEAAAVVLGAGAGTSIAGPTGAQMVIKAGAAATHGAYALIEYTHAPGAAGPPAHVHHEHEEAFYVLAGQLTLLLGNETVTVEPGGFVVVPRGMVHRPSNAGSDPVRFFFITSPAIDGFFVEMSDLMARTQGRPGVAELREIGDRWDSYFVDLPEIGEVVMDNESGSEASSAD